MVESSYLKRDVERNTFIQPINEMVKSPAKQCFFSNFLKDGRNWLLLKS